MVSQDSISLTICADINVDNSTTISVAWIYQKPIPKNVITNIGDLADSNHDICAFTVGQLSVLMQSPSFTGTIIMIDG